MSASVLVLPSTPTHVSFESIGKTFAILRQMEVDIAAWADFNTIKVANPNVVCTVEYIQIQLTALT
jgi:hypothetical protein